MYGFSIHFLYILYGKCTELYMKKWFSVHICPENVRNYTLKEHFSVHICPENVWKMYGKCTENAWKMCGISGK